MSGPRFPGRLVITDEEFVEAWQQSTSVDEVMDRLRFHGSKQTISNRVAALRKLGVPLKAMDRGPTARRKANAPNLIALALSAARVSK